MRPLLLLACLALASASYIPYQGYGYDQYGQKYGDSSAASNAYQYGTYGQYANGAQDNKYGYVKGASNAEHEEYHTATKHKIDEERHEISHKADNKLAAASHNDYAKKDGQSYQAGANQHYADKGSSGKESGHDSVSYQAGGHGAHGAHDSNKVADHQYNSQHDSYNKYGDAANSQYGAHGSHAAASADQAYKTADYLNHYELHAKKDEDYNHKEASHKSNKNDKYHQGYDAHSANGDGKYYSTYAAGHDSQNKDAYGHQNAYNQPGYYGYGGQYGQAQAGHAAGAGHVDYTAQYGGYNYQQAAAGQHQDAGKKSHADEKNTYKEVTRKLKKEEHEVKHDDGKSQDAYGNKYGEQGHHNYNGAQDAAHHGAQASSAYKKQDSHYAAHQHQPAAYYPAQY